MAYILIFHFYLFFCSFFDLLFVYANLNLIMIHSLILLLLSLYNIIIISFIDRNLTPVF